MPVRYVQISPSAFLGVKPQQYRWLLIRFACAATDEAHPAEAFFSIDLLEQAASDAMALSGVFSLCGLVLLLLAAVVLRFGIRTLGQSEAVHRWQINAVASDPAPASTFSEQAPQIGVDSSFEPFTERSEPVAQPQPQPETDAGLQPQ